MEEGNLKLIESNRKYELDRKDRERQEILKLRGKVERDRKSVVDRK